MSFGPISQVSHPAGNGQNVIYFQSAMQTTTIASSTKGSTFSSRRHKQIEDISMVVETSDECIVKETWRSDDEKLSPIVWEPLSAPPSLSSPKLPSLADAFSCPGSAEIPEVVSYTRLLKRYLTSSFRLSFRVSDDFNYMLDF